MATVATRPQHDDIVDQGDEPLFEIIDGNRIELPPMGAYSSIIASRLLGAIAKANKLGETVTETLFHLPLPADRNRRPDVAFVSYDRWPKGKPISWSGNAWNVVPNLAVEVISPNDLAYEILEKIAEYFRAGVNQVWVVYPSQRIVHVYSSFTSIRVITRDESLEASDLLPGFRLPLADLFTEELLEPENGSSNT